MKRTILVLGLTVTCSLSVFSQRAQTGASGQGSGNASATTSRDDRRIDIQSGTRLAAELQNTIDVRKARIGDEVLLKTTHAIKSEGRTVVNKGARLIGHVTQVEQKTKASGESRVGIVFDRLETGSLEYPISAMIISVTRAAAGVRSGEDLAQTSVSSESNSSVRSTSNTQSGGLIGGVGNTVGGVVSNTTSTVGTVVSATTGAAGGAVDATGRTLGGAAAGSSRSLERIQITESSSSSAKGGLILSLRGDDLRLEKGVTFNLLLNQSANAGTAN